MNQQFWNTKKLLERKLGKKEDSSIVASDAELDLKLELFENIKDSCNNLSNIVEVLKERMNDLAKEQNNLGRFLRETGKNSSTSKAIMQNTGKVISFTGQQNLTMQTSLCRILQEINTFKFRAIQDCKKTISAMEQNRTQYRAALSAMKSCSVIDPDTGKGLEKYRQVQQYVRFAKSKFDKWSLVCLQKIDLLAASRCNLYSYNLVSYCKDFENLNIKNLEVLTSNIQQIEPSKHIFSGVLKDLGTDEEAQEKPTEEKKKEVKEIKDADQKLFFGEEYSDQPTLKAVSNNEETPSQAGKLIDYENDYLDELMSSSNILLPSQLLLQDSMFFNNPEDPNQQPSQFSLMTNDLIKPNPSGGENLLNNIKSNIKEESTQKANTKKNVNWYDLFAELDPLSQQHEACKADHAA